MGPHALSGLLGSEQEFFDKEASRLSQQELLIPTPQDIQRYQDATLTWRSMAKDALFALLKPLERKRVLDYGCGHGENACLLAACGAQVTAFDLSPASIEQARKRAELHGLGRIQFDVRAAGSTEYAAGSFDVVTGFGILHHLHMMLPAVYEEVHRVLKPGGVAAFIEPVANSPVLSGIRRVLPVACYATPDERQLTYRDLTQMQVRFVDLRMLHFDGLGRLRRILGHAAVRPLLWFDYWAQRLVPPITRFYGTVVVLARRPDRS